MIEIRDFAAIEDLYKARRVMRYVLVWCSSGSATLVVDEDTFEIKPNQVITITSGQVHYFKNNVDAKGFVLEFTYDFFCISDNDLELVFQNGLFCHFGENELITLGENSLVGQELMEIQRELAEEPYQFLVTIHSRIELILVSINRSKLVVGSEVWKPDALFLKFLETVRNNFDKNLSVAQIALMLQTTESKLNEYSKLHTGKTAQKVIYGLVISEAKRLFRYDSLSVKEVAYQLGFNDPFYFSNFFKKFTRLSPKSFKEMVNS